MNIFKKYRLYKIRKRYDKLYPDLVTEVGNISWHHTPDEQSLEILRKFLVNYKAIPADNINVECLKNQKRIMYTADLLEMDEFFRKGEITKAANTLDSLIQNFPLFQAGLKENLTKLLEKYIL